jgi:type I restriction enzyme S subunit
MALCNELEARQQKQQQGRVRLNNSALDALLTAREPDEFADHWQRISTNFDLLYDHPETIAKLRAAILQLAVQGRLVPQDPNDEPASVLLERIKAEKERLVKGRETKSPKFLLDQKIAFEWLPSSWKETRLGDLTVFGPQNGYSPRPVEHKTNTKSLTLSATTRGTFDPRRFKFVDEPVEENSSLWLEDGDILIQRGNSLDYVGIGAVYQGQRNEFIYPDLMMKVRVSQSVKVGFAHLVINCQSSREFFQGNASGTSGSMPKVNQAVVNSLPLPLPPLAEQKRIVAKVDQLMALCNELEAKLNQSQQHSQKLMEATVLQLLGTSTPQNPHTARAPAAPAAGKSGRPARHAYQPAPAIAEPIAAETAVVYGGSVPETILAVMQPGQEYSRAAVLAATSIREADWMWAIKQLKDQRRVAQTGEKRGARYRLK